MKERIGLDAIGYLGDVMFEESDAPIPSMKTTPLFFLRKRESESDKQLLGYLPPEPEKA